MDARRPRRRTGTVYGPALPSGNPVARPGRASGCAVGFAPLRVLAARPRLVAALTWLSPSFAAACTGALAAGALEGWGEGVLGGAAAVGFVALVAVPALLALGVALRGLAAAWPIDVDADGAAPGLAGWLVTLGACAALLSAAMYHGIWLLSLYTAFKPATLSFVVPAVAVAVALVLVVVSRPIARMFAWLFRALDARWRRRGHATLLRPRRIAGATAVLAIIAVYIVWRVVIRPRLGTFETGVFVAPAVGLLGALVAHRLRTRRAALITGGLSALAIAAALVTVWLRPARTLEIWGDRPLAGLAIDAVFDLGAIRDRMSIAQFRPLAQPGARHPDIVLITIDTVRADHTPPYGGTAEMPALRDLAARGTVFEWAFSPSNVTRRSIPSMVTGLAPDRVRGRVVGWALRVDPRHVLLAERLRAGGYDTAGFMCCEGFWGKDFHTGLERGLAHLEIDPNGPSLAARARRWLDARRDRDPLFLWMHILEPHNWTKASGEPRSEDDRRRFYDRSLAASDQMAQQVLGAFADRAPDRQPIVIITADHGEGLGDHGQAYHSTDLYNSQIHVPLVIAGPGVAVRRIPETVSLTDLVPTLLELAGFVPPSGTALDGRSLADFTRGTRPGDPESGTAFAAMIKDRSNPGGLTAVVRGRWKLIDHGGRLELYDTRGDPAERNNLSLTHPQITAELKAWLEQRTGIATISPF